MLTRNLLSIGADRLLYVASDRPLGGWRRLGAVSLVVGLSGAVRVAIASGDWLSCRSVLIGTGVPHRIDANGEVAAVMYLEPDSPEARAACVHLRPQGGVILDAAKPLSHLGAVDSYLQNFDLRALLDRRLAPAAPVDARVAAGLRLLRNPGEARVSRPLAALEAGLSESRFNHLFRDEMGVSFRHYRAWSQLLGGLRAKKASVSLTEVAALAGFADLSHFSRTFRSAFGVWPSDALARTPIRLV